jgi:diacylglycerol kinase (ATP)
LKEMKHTVKFANWLNKWNSWSNQISVILATLIFVVVFVYLLKLKRRRIASYFLRITGRINKGQQQQPLNQHHNWHMNDLFNRPTYCNVCECVMVSGVYCTFCNLFADDKCLKKADKLFKCKQLCMNYETRSNSAASPLSNKEPQLENQHHQQHQPAYIRKWPHHWIKGNLPLSSNCFVCNDECGSQPSLSDYKCVWCWRTAHEKCLDRVSTPSLVDECNFGEHQQLILKPDHLTQTVRLPGLANKSVNLSLNDVKLNEALISSLAPSQFILESKLNENIDSGWTPLFVFANLKSGSNDADHIIRAMSTYLNPLQVLEMNNTDPDEVLAWMSSYSHLVKFKILVCGGDGSIGWILSLISKLKFKRYEPAVAILPLGTGNDLSRALKWGAGYVGDVDILDILTDIGKAKYVKLDR